MPHELAARRHAAGEPNDEAAEGIGRVAFLSAEHAAVARFDQHLAIFRRRPARSDQQTEAEAAEQRHHDMAMLDMADLMREHACDLVGVEHPGTKGKQFFEKAEPIIINQSERIIHQEVRSYLARNFAG